MMDRPIVNIPPSIMRLFEVDWDISWGQQDAGTNTAGNTGAVQNAFPRWVGRVRLGLVNEEIAQWRAIRAQAQGRVALWRVAFSDSLKAMPAYAGEALGVPYSTSQRHSTGFGFEYRPFVTLTSAASLGAVRATVSGAADHVPLQGQFLSDETDWPTMVVGVTDLGSDIWRLDLQMPLRRALVAGDRLYLAAKGLFEAVEPASGAVKYTLSQSARPLLELREVLSR